MYWYCRNMGRNQLEIYNAALFLQAIFQMMIFVVGIVRGYEATLELVEEIAGKVYEQTGAGYPHISVRKRTGRLR